MGRIGCAVAHRLKVIGGNILYHNRKRLKSIEKRYSAKYFSDL